MGQKSDTGTAYLWHFVWDDIIIAGFCSLFYYILPASALVVSEATRDNTAERWLEHGEHQPFRHMHDDTPPEDTSDL